MCVAPNLCADETKNRGTYTRVTKSNNHIAQKEVQFSRGYEILKVHVNLLLRYFEKDSLDSEGHVGSQSPSSL